MRLPDQRINLGERVARHVAGPGQLLGRVEDREIGWRTRWRGDELGGAWTRNEPAAQFVGIADRGRKTGRLHRWRDRTQPRKIEAQEIAAFRGNDGVQFVDDDALEIGEEVAGIRAGEEKRQLFGGRQKDLRRIAPLALALGGRGVACPRLDPDREADLGNRRLEIAGYVDGERLER